MYDDHLLYKMNLGFLIGGLAVLAIGIPVGVISCGSAEQKTASGYASIERCLAIGIAPGALGLMLDL